MGGTEEAIVTHLDKAFGQNVLQETVNEFLGGERAEPGVTGVGFVAKGDLIILHLDDTAVAEGDAKDVRGEILERGATVADGFAVDNPILLPYGSGDTRKAIGFTQRITKLGAKEFRKRLDG